MQGNSTGALRLAAICSRRFSFELQLVTMLLVATALAGNPEVLSAASPPSRKVSHACHAACAGKKTVNRSPRKIEASRSNRLAIEEATTGNRFPSGSPGEQMPPSLTLDGHDAASHATMVLKFD
jgi:hypothetical protein